MPLDWLTASWPSLARIAMSAVVIFAWLLLTVRVVGLRTFSKMASVDFAVTVASGAVLATTVTSASTTVAQGLRQARVSVDDVRAKLREANVLRYDEVRAVVLETTGDISVLHGDAELELDLIDGVRGAEHLARDERT